MHMVDTQQLRKRGLHHEADVLDSLPPPSPPLAPPPAPLVTFGDERNAHRGQAAAGSAARGGFSMSVEAVGGGAPGSSDAASAGAPSAADSSSASASSAESSQEPGEETGQHPQHHPSEHLGEHPSSQPDKLHADPFAGLYSDHLKQRLEREAFAGASSTAQDSAIAREAVHLLPPELRTTLRHDLPRVDISPAARAERIAALHGEIPDWARGDPSHDPAIIRAMESRTASVSESLRDSKPETAREAAQSPARPSRTAAETERER